MASMTRRDFVRLQLYGGAWLALGGASGLACNRKKGRETRNRVIALGLDGMDPQIVGRMMREGKLPTFLKIARQGMFGALGTSNPPQSPVAWSNFISGCNPGGHGIFDFIHRHPENYIPYLSTSATEPASRNVTIGDYVIPLSSGKVLDLRQGKAFWEDLEEHDVPATVFKMPSNFPPTATGQKTLSGMGTPDILGTYGIFSYYTDSPTEIDPDLGGGVVYPVSFRDDSFQATLAGPTNTYRKGTPASGLEFSVFRDPVNPVAKIVVADREIMLRQGEWSDWVQVAFPMVPMVNVRGICRFYLREVHPNFKLYVSPVNIDPGDPALPISTPDDYARELYKKFGPYHTKGLPADTKALGHGVLDEQAFLEQDEHILRERLDMFDYELDRFDSGLLYWYISSTDQRSHMFWRLADPRHPAYDPKLAARFGDTIENVYREMDRLLDRTLRKVDRDTWLLAFSDHGFTPYYRSVHLNSWLMDHGYLVLKDDRLRGETEYLQNVDWHRTKAYALGFNGLYVNERGREGMGSVSRGQKRALVEKLVRGLEGIRDPESEMAPVAKAYKATDCYSGPYSAAGPDIVVGYNRGYRASWQTALGKVPRNWFENNDKKWSGDHCMAADLLPGMFLSNRDFPRAGEPALQDLTATILAALEVPVPERMNGRSLV